MEPYGIRMSRHTVTIQGKKVRILSVDNPYRWLKVTPEQNCLTGSI
jgi:hypothetical protein